MRHQILLEPVFESADESSHSDLLILQEELVRHFHDFFFVDPVHLLGIQDHVFLLNFNCVQLPNSEFDVHSDDEFI